MGKKRLTLLFSFLLLSIFSLFLQAQENNPRMLIHILDYLAQDYSGSVSHGKVINVYEYQEQTEFVASALRIAHNLDETKSNAPLLEDLSHLQQSILNKESAEVVSQKARQIQSQLIQASKIELAPKEWPHLAKGQILFEQNCVTCHGSLGKGDGSLAKNITPPPTNFWNVDRMKQLSSFQIFNTIRLGVTGTSMPAFEKLSDKEVWDLAFYIQSLRYSDSQKSVSGDLKNLSLDQLSSLSDAALLEKLHLNSQNANSELAYLRLYQPHSDGNSLEVAHQNLQLAQDAYHKGDFAQAKAYALTSYLEGVEPIEQKLRSLDLNLVTQIEGKMADLRTQMGTSASVEIIDQKILEVKGLLGKAEGLLASSYAQTRGFVFLMAFSIILREGFEAVLILVTILSVVKMLGAKKAVVWTHAGWISALLCGVLAWLFSGWLLNMSGASRESMEGFTSLFAVLVLLYVGFWLHSKSEIGKWTSFIKQQMDSALQGSKLFGIWAISFVAVFREVFETVLFLRALWLEGGSSDKNALMMGILTSFALIFFLANVFLRWSVKLPIGKLFNLSAGMMVVLAVILTGKGLHALQSAGYLPTTSLSVPFQFPLLGLFPSMETFIPQCMILALIALIWRYSSKTHHHA